LIHPGADLGECAGGVRFAALDDGLMLKSIPGVFCAGEMIDWEAPTGGYLLTACFASGRIAGAAAAGAATAAARMGPTGLAVSGCCRAGTGPTGESGPFAAGTAASSFCQAGRPVVTVNSPAVSSRSRYMTVSLPA